MSKRITIREVAKEAGMSVATVSGALNGVPGYAQDTIRKVWEVANRLNYKPRASARNLQAGGDDDEPLKTHLITHIISRGYEELNIFGEVAASISSLSYKAQKRNYFVIPYTYYKLDGFRCPPLLNGYVEGALIGTPHAEVAQIVSSKIPTVLMDVPNSLDLPGVPMVNGDWGYGTALLMKRLQEYGHKNIAFLQPYDKDPEPVNRNIIWSARKAAEECGLKVHEKYSYKEDLWPHNNREHIEACAKKMLPGILNGEITAVFAPHTSYLKHLKALLEEGGVRIPQDCSLCAPIVSVEQPELITCAWLDHGKIFDTALDLLLDIIAGKKSDIQEVLLRPVLLENQTIAAVPSKKKKVK